MSDSLTSTATFSPEQARWPLILSIASVIMFVVVSPLMPLKRPVIQENRVLTARPPFPMSVAEWAELPKKLESYGADNFPLRGHLISFLNEVRYDLGYSGSKRIIVGREGWLFYDTDDHLGITAGKVRMDQANLALWLKGFEQRVAFLKSRGIAFYMLMAPVKEDIFPEYRPVWMPQQRVLTEIDDFHRVTTEAGYTQLVDPRPKMLRKKNEQKLYDKYDTHWTGLGGYIGYSSLMARVAQDFPELAPLPLSQFAPVNIPSTQQPRDLALMLGVKRLPDKVSYATVPEHDARRTHFLGPREDWTAPAILHTGSSSGKTLLLIRDSFSHELLPFLKPHFSNIIVAHTQDGFFRRDLIEEYKPDVVVLEVIETGARFTMDLLPSTDP